MAIKAVAALVPRHYTLSVTATPDSMLRIVLGLRRLVQAFDAGDEVEQLLAACEEAYVDDLPTAPTLPADEPPADTAS